LHWADTIILAATARMALSSKIETLKAADYRITDSEFSLADDEQDFVEPVSDGECSSDGEEEIPETDSDGEDPQDGPVNLGKRKRVKDRTRMQAKRLKKQEEQETMSVYMGWVSVYSPGAFRLSAAELLHKAKGGKGSLANRTISSREDISTPVIHHGSGYIGNLVRAPNDCPNTVDELLACGYRLIKTGES
jgi:hypothetical protein